MEFHSFILLSACLFFIFYLTLFLCGFLFYQKTAIVVGTYFLIGLYIVIGLYIIIHLLNTNHLLVII